MDKALPELRSLVARAQNRRTDTGIPRVAMVQGAVPEHELAAVYDPMVNVILQGSKIMTVGERQLHYDPATYFVMSVDLPAIGAVHPAETGEPYLAVTLTLDPLVLASLLTDLPSPVAPPSDAAGFSVAAMTTELMDAWVRMLRLMKSPADIPALAPSYEREILYRILQGPCGWLLSDIATPDSALSRIGKAIHWIRKDFAKPLRIEALAERAAMSPATFHRHFKAVTALSPLQYQKRVRLLRARTLLLTEGGNVTSVAIDVGYESPTQFSREYARTFGLAPSRDAKRIQEARTHGRLIS